MKYFFLLAIIFAISSASLFSHDKVVIDSRKSQIRWEGNKIVGGHWGTVIIKEGFLKMNSHKLSGGEFTIDMKTIEVLDLKENEGKFKLEGHLMSDDFFSTDKYPTAKLVITEVSEVPNARRGQANANIKANLTIRGITHSISFPATVNHRGSNFSANADITIDRTKWDIKYNSGNFFKDLGDRMIKDEIVFKVRLSS